MKAVPAEFGLQPLCLPQWSWSVMLKGHHLTGLLWQVGVSMVLSFMVVWDLPAISKGISSLRSSRLSAIYNEVAPFLSVFGMLFGKALQAQVRRPDVCVCEDVEWDASSDNKRLLRRGFSTSPCVVSAGVDTQSIVPV